MRILVCGPESSGTKMVTEYVMRAAEWRDDVEVIHRSYPYGGGPRPSHVEWPPFPMSWDVAVVVTRDWYAMKCSQAEAGHAGGHYLERWIREAYERIFHEVAGRRFYVIPYESVVLHPESLQPIFAALGLRWTPELVASDANAKYYGGPAFRDQRPVEERVGRNHAE